MHEVGRLRTPLFALDHAGVAHVLVSLPGSVANVYGEPAGSGGHHARGDFSIAASGTIGGPELPARGHWGERGPLGERATSACDPRIG
jgi:hypothetical protein